MIRIFDCNAVARADILKRSNPATAPETERIAAEILRDVAERGDAAVLDCGQKFDGVRPDALRVTEDETKAAISAAGPEFIRILRGAAENIRLFHERQKGDGFELKRENGIVLGLRVLPLSKVGIYVPGGTASYPSSVLMNAIPAHIAGVKRIVMASPPGENGEIAAAVLAAASVAGVTDVFKMGGAQAIAALAYGTESVPKVDKIVGPGNRFVAAAKRLVFGEVDIDMIAGPSEILVIADSSASPEHVAADMLSQAEHDALAAAVLICDSAGFAENVSREIERQLPLLPRADIARASIDDNGKIIVTPDLCEAIEIANEIAPEHLELCVREPFKYLDDIKNAGSVFLGMYTPEALGDYWAGPNHVLPTLGTARFRGPLSVEDFVKRSSYIYYTKEALREAKGDVAAFAEKEGLHAHARSVTIRFDDHTL